MTDRDRELMALGHGEIHAELQAIAEGSVAVGRRAQAAACYYCGKADNSSWLPHSSH